MAGAYATLASGGVRHRPTGLERVVFPDGKSENLANTQGQARAHGRGGLRGHEDPQDERPVRHGHRGQLRLSGGREDRHDGRGEGRLVRRLHARGLGRRVGRLPGRRHRDAGRAGRHLRRAGMARLHAPRPRRLLRRLPAADGAGALLAVLRQVLAHRLVEHLLRARPPAARPRPTRTSSTTRASTSRPRSTRRRRSHRPKRSELPRPATGTAMGTATASRAGSKQSP